MRSPTATPATAPASAAPRDGVPGPGQFGILFVCTGNVCRSVIAERLAWRGLRARLGPDACRFRVASAGTAGLAGRPLHPYTAEALTWLGADAEGFASRELTAADVDAADLILAAGREHRDLVVAMRPRASRRAYLIREFARVAAFATGTATGGTATGGPIAGEPAAGPSAVVRARHLVAEVAQLRGWVPYVEPAEDEIADPVTTSAAFLDCARTIDAAVRQALDSLCRGLPRALYQGRHAR